MGGLTAGQDNFVKLERAGCPAWQPPFGSIGPAQTQPAGVSTQSAMPTRYERQIDGITYEWLCTSTKE